MSPKIGLGLHNFLSQFNFGIHRQNLAPPLIGINSNRLNL